MTTTTRYGSWGTLTGGREGLVPAVPAEFYGGEQAGFDMGEVDAEYADACARVFAGYGLSLLGDGEVLVEVGPVPDWEEIGDQVLQEIHDLDVAAIADRHQVA